MSKLSEMIARLCPNGVEYKKLGDVARICRGVRVVRKDLIDNGKYAVYQNSLKPLGYFNEANVKGGTAFVIGAGAAGEVGYSEQDFWAADDCYYIDGGDQLIGRYVYYCLTSRQGWLESKTRKASIPRLSRDFVAALEIPLPPLPVQREIV
ncbi:MAG: restriction endonuclease subunit S, partial [Kiritimatiellae bacterium]|nr:restriction endonuclease subunit S [Kiritimatiellia bacterium]